MSGIVEFRLLSEQSDWLEQTMLSLHQDLQRFGKLAVLSPDRDRLEAISEVLWQQAAEQFITYAFASEGAAEQVQLLLTDQISEAASRPALLNIGYLLDSDSYRFRHISEIVLADPETVDKARRQYRMYRNSGYRINHEQLA